MFRRRQEKKNDLNLTVTDGKDIQYDEEIPIESIDDDDDASIIDDESPRNDTKRINFDSDTSESDDPEIPIVSNSPPDKQKRPSDLIQPGNLATISHRTNQTSKAGPSRETILNRPKSGARLKPARSPSESESDSDDGLMIMEHAREPIPGEYDPDKYNDLQVTEDIKELFQYITKYTPQNLNLDYKFCPFIPDYIPAVGDIDAFLKIIPPDRMLGSNESVNFNELGLGVLDEPAANQSDSALLHLQLRAVSVTTNKDNKNMIIKKVDNIEKNSKTIDKWILDISDLHRSKPPPMVKYTNPMPDLDNLMQEWPQPVEQLLNKDGFPSHKLHCSLTDYTDLACAIFDIPVYEKRIQSIHMFFCLYLAIKNSQLYNVASSELQTEKLDGDGGTTDQLILD